MDTAGGTDSGGVDSGVSDDGGDVGVLADAGGGVDAGCVPSVEVCDGDDDDCDGTIDDGDPVALCPAGVGVASVACVAGACEVMSCNTGLGDCNGSAADGCENDLRSLEHCGGCGTACALANASESCASGTCALGACDTGFANCDGMVDTGCETSLADPLSCGACRRMCVLPNTTPRCVGGMCLPGPCNPGFGDCDGLPENGCETALTTATNCGACGAACNLPNASESCATGTCTVTTCAAGFGDCDLAAANGCEEPVTTVTSCGACGVACAPPNATATCATGACVATGCVAGFGDCDGLPGNGCELPTRSATDCGGCGVACAPVGGSGDCSSGACTITGCDAGRFDVDGMASTGCECVDDTAAASCTGPATAIGDVAVLASFDVTGTIPLASGEDWYRVDFSGVGSGRPTVTFVTNDGSAYLLDVFASCGGTPRTCGVGGMASGITTWAFVDTAVVAPGGTTRDQPWPATIYVRVRRVTAGLSCARYTLRVSRPSF